MVYDPGHGTSFKQDWSHNLLILLTDCIKTINLIYERYKNTNLFMYTQNQKENMQVQLVQVVHKNYKQLPHLCISSKKEAEKVHQP